MEIYDITQEGDQPWLTFNGLPEAAPLVAAMGMGEAKLVRAIYQGFAVVSALFAVPMRDGGVELFLFGREGMAHVTAFDTDHHHVSMLAARPKAYSEALGVDMFFMRSSTRLSGFFTKRFPAWTEFEHEGALWAGLEVA